MQEKKGRPGLSLKLKKQDWDDKLDQQEIDEMCSAKLPDKLMKVDEYIYISSYKAACNEAALSAEKIEVIINLASKDCPNLYPEKYSYLSYALNDINGEDIQKEIAEVSLILHQNFQKGLRTLVHCYKVASSDPGHLPRPHHARRLPRAQEQALRRPKHRPTPRHRPEN
jgi:hypothetical protein